MTHLLAALLQIQGARSLIAIVAVALVGDGLAILVGFRLPAWLGGVAVRHADQTWRMPPLVTGFAGPLVPRLPVPDPCPGLALFAGLGGGGSG